VKEYDEEVAPLIAALFWYHWYEYDTPDGRLEEKEMVWPTSKAVLLAEIVA
jgi:hypothetical protein